MEIKATNFYHRKCLAISVLALIIMSVIGAEEQSILVGNTVSDFESWDRNGLHLPQFLTSQNFRDSICSSYHAPIERKGVKEFSIFLAKKYKVHSSFVQNRYTSSKEDTYDM
jgi:hypothetical protein